jgi:hypothetical protein
VSSTRRSATRLSVPLHSLMTGTRRPRRRPSDRSHHPTSRRGRDPDAPPRSTLVRSSRATCCDEAGSNGDACSTSLDPDRSVRSRSTLHPHRAAAVRHRHVPRRHLAALPARHHGRTREREVDVSPRLGDGFEGSSFGPEAGATIRKTVPTSIDRRTTSLDERATRFARNATSRGRLMTRRGAHLDRFSRHEASTPASSGHGSHERLHDERPSEPGSSAAILHPQAFDRRRRGCLVPGSRVARSRGISAAPSPHPRCISDNRGFPARTGTRPTDRRRSSIPSVRSLVGTEG